jgi:hypothetical protein
MYGADVCYWEPRESSITLAGVEHDECVEGWREVLM